MSLLTRKQWREGDVTLLEVLAAQLGMKVPEPPNNGLLPATVWYLCTLVLTSA
jgi:hypothetical protein